MHRFDVGDYIRAELSTRMFGILITIGGIGE